MRKGKINWTNGNMNRAKYFEMFNQEIIPQLNIACENIFNRYWRMQDGAAAHRTLIAGGNLRRPHN